MTKVRDVMTSDMEYCTPEDNIYEVSVKMKENDIGIVPILEDGEVIGVITDRDIVVSGTAEKKPGSTSVTSIMTTDLTTVTSDTSVEEAAELMARHQVRRLPVVDDKILVGMVSLGDLATNRSTKELAGDTLTDISEDDDFF